MFFRYITRFPLAVLGTGLLFVGLAYVVTIFTFGYFFKFLEYQYSTHILVAIFFITSSYLTHTLIVEEYRRKVKLSDKNAEVWKKSVLEQSLGYPSLMEAIEQYEKYKDDELSNHLATKKHPARKSAEIVKRETKKRREAEKITRITKSLIDYYESIAPFLIDFKNEIIDDQKEKNLLKDYNEAERSDPVTNFLTKHEYRKLSTSEKNQLALERFWQRPKSKRLIGKLYERYVGYLYETQGYEIDYVGIIQGYEDLGRDLICKRGNEILIIQCKNWSQFRTIYEKHIFQFFGTVFQYRDSNLDKNVRAIFYTTTGVSGLARKFAHELKIELIENHIFEQSYPCIKCNINPSTKEKIYHLPFDQMYDRVKICKAGEFYCRSVKESEDNGFRRAFRWKGISQAM